MEPAGQDVAQKVPTTLENLTSEEKRCDLYVTAIHELNRLRYRCAPRRLNRIAGDLGLNADQLRLTWCLLHAAERSRRRSLAVRPSVKKSYLHVLHGRVCPQDDTITPDWHGRVSKGDVREATEALLAAGSSVADRRKRIAAMLNGRELEFQMREEVKYEDDVSLSSDEEDASLKGLCMRAVQQLPNAESVRPEEVSSVAARVATLAEALKRGDNAVGVSEDVLRMTNYRTEALRWLSRTEDRGKTLKRSRTMAEGIESISEEAGVRLHPVVKRALRDAFADEEALAEGGLQAFRALLPAKVYGIVTAREVRRLMERMKAPDAGIAERLIETFGSARRCLRAGVREVCERFGDCAGRTALERLHGFDGALHSVLAGHVGAVWLVARVLKEKFGGLAEWRRRSFGEFVDGRGEIVELCMDERLAAYQAVHAGSEGVEHERFEASWAVLRAVCAYTDVDDCVAVAARSPPQVWRM